MRRGQAGALFERLFGYAVVVFYCVMLAVMFSRSLVSGFVMIGFTIAVGLLILAFAYFRERRAGSAFVAARRADLEKAAAAHDAVIETVFVGEGEGRLVALFGVAGAARKLIFARETYRKERTRVLEFDQLTAAFARPDGEDRYRLEVRTRAADARPPLDALYLKVGQREEAERWVRVLQPHLGDRVRFVETAEG